MNRMMKALKSGFHWPDTAASRVTATAPVSPAASASADRGAKAPSKRHRGLGDVMKAATSAVGITPCGSCQKRAEWLNRKFPLE